MAQKEVIYYIVFLALLISASAQGSYDAQGGNITRLDLSTETQTRIWQGIPSRITFIGPDAPPSVNATGGDVNYTQFFITSPCTNPVSVTGFILFSNSTAIPAGLTAGNISQLEQFINNASTDSANRTFTQTSTFVINGAPINNVPTTHTYVNNQSQNISFREGYLNDAAGNIVFAVEVDINTQGYNSSFFDFQTILPTANRTTTTYYVSTDLNIACPQPERRAGGGGGGIYCLPDYICTNWTRCEGGYQYRDCRVTGACRGIGLVPSMMRKCGAEEQKPRAREKEIIDNIRELYVEVKTPEMILAYIGETIETMISVTNPNKVSLEKVTATVKMPTLLQRLRPLHTDPRLYEPFKTKPIGKAIEKDGWKITKNIPEQIGPGERIDLPLKADTPMIMPQAIPAQIEIRSGPVKIYETETTIVTETRPFKLKTLKEGYDTTIMIAIDNRQREQRSTSVELDINKGRSTLFTEVYKIELPADTVALYGYKYYTPYKYDSIIARFEGKKEEKKCTSSQ